MLPVAAPRTPHRWWDTDRVLYAVCGLLIAASWAFRWSLVPTREFDADEFQHLHAAWLLHEGALPFRDFFEHHMPGIYYLLAGLPMVFSSSAGADGIVSTVLAARGVMMFFAAVATALTIGLGVSYRGWAVGWLSGALLSLSVVFVARTLEIRPDVPALALWTACQLALLRGLAVDDGRRRLWFAVSGVCLGGTLLFTQKALLAGPGLAVFAIAYVVMGYRARLHGRRAVDIVTLLVSCAGPILLMAAYFWRQGALGDLVEGVLLNNLGWPREVRTLTTLRWMLLRDPMLCALGAAGGLQAALLLWRSRDLPGAAVLLPAASLLAGAFLIPTPYPQYMLLILPAVAVHGASFLWTMLQSLGTGTSRPLGLKRWLPLAVLLLVTSFALSIAQPYFRHAAVFPLVGVTSIGLALLAGRRGAHRVSAAILVSALSLYSLQQLTWMTGLSNRDAMEQMRFIHDVTTPRDRVMDGFTGFAWFRPHASPHWFVPPGARARLSSEDLSDFTTQLNDCARRPRLVILDDHLSQVSPEVAPSVARHYNRTMYPTLWIARESAPCVGGRH